MIENLCSELFDSGFIYQFSICPTKLTFTFSFSFLFQFGVFETLGKIINGCQSVPYSVEFYTKSYEKEADF